MKKVVKLLFFLFLIMSFSCEKQGLIVYCPDCTQDEPLTTYIEVQLESSLNSQALVQIYEGNLEDNALLYSEESSASTYYHEVAINNKYTVTATYNLSGNTYIAVDSATPKVKYSKEQCDNPCYFVYNKVFNLKLKYTK